MGKTRGTVRAALPVLVIAALASVSAATISPLAPDLQRPVDLRNKDNFRSGSELVTTAVTVRDAAGRLVTTLEQKDFNVEEDGVQQPITQFTKERIPISLSLALDISDSMRGQRIADARGALDNFLANLLDEKDETSLIGFNHEARILSPWTSDRAALRARLDAIIPSGGTAMYDAIQAALPQFESREHPRAAILLVSDGKDTASDMTPTKLKQTLVRSDVFLYAIGIDSLDARNSTRINPFTLQELTAQGGGYTEIIHNTTDLGPATERIADELNHQYMIGYTPTSRGDGKYHSVRVRVSDDTLKVRARRGVIR